MDCLPKYNKFSLMPVEGVVEFFSKQNNAGI